MHRAVVTGGLGFIGSHVVDALVADGREVTIVDSMVAAVTDGREYEAAGCVVHRVSIADYLAGGGTFAGADLVVHAASHVGPAGILRHQGTLGADIVGTTQLVVEECVEHDIALVAFSSAEVYGRSGLLQEHDDLVVPVHYNVRLEYAIAKTLTEAVTINSRHRGLRGPRHPPVQRRRAAPVARRRLRDADVRAAGARRPPADRVRRRRAAARVPVRRRPRALRHRAPRRRAGVRRPDLQPRQPEPTPRRCGGWPS